MLYAYKANKQAKGRSSGGIAVFYKNNIKQYVSCIYSVRHVLIDCIDLGLIRPRFYSVPDMKTLFDTVSVDRIISFVKEINLFSKI